MTRDVRVHLLPALFEPEELRGGIAVILDILRASTTITHALAYGARGVIPTLDVETAQAVARQFPAGTVLTGGEREGLLIPGFDLDNNPFAYTRDIVAEKTIVFTTTNGTKALHRAALASRVVIGSFVNLRAVVDLLARTDAPVHLVCAGTRGKLSLEDVACAGAIAWSLAETLGVGLADWTDDSLQLATRLEADARASSEGTLNLLRSSYGGRNCRRLGFDDQIARAATRDLFDIVPEYHGATEQITI
jgi:2-phosphosulfolactate phosphatase